jgi:hypothetical protein
MSDTITRLRAPGIALICLGVLNALTAGVLLLGRLANLISGNEPLITDEARRLGYEVSNIYFPLVSLMSLADAPLIIFGGIQMLSVRRYPLAVVAAILALIPFSSVCCLAGIPIGIWALLVLRNPEVKAVFQTPQTPMG